jgi:membrane protein required for colicin V production
MDFSKLDLAIMAVMALSTIAGLMRGMVREVLSLLIWVGAFFASINYAYLVAPYLEFIKTPLLRNSVAGSILFGSVLILGALINFIVARIMRAGSLGGTDRFLGMLFGILRGALIVVVVAWLVQFTPVVKSELWTHSKLVPQVNVVVQSLEKKMPKSWYEKAKKLLNNVSGIDGGSMQTMATAV